MQQQENVMRMMAIGRIRREEKAIVLEIDAPYRPALDDLHHFSHVMVFWWADAFDNDEARARLHIKPPYAPDRSIGVFATRSPFRPNPIAMTTCPIVDLDVAAGRVTVTEIDAFDGTRIVDLKAYLPFCDRVREPRVAPWLAGWPDRSRGAYARSGALARLAGPRLAYTGDIREHLSFITTRRTGGTPYENTGIPPRRDSPRHLRDRGVRLRVELPSCRR